jgi:hypothetical protein
MPIRVDIQRVAELDDNIDFPATAWFDAVPRQGEVIQLRAGANTLSPRTVLGVNYVESEPGVFRVLVVVE